MLAIDTETTGLDVRHGCVPFIIATYDGSIATIYEWDIDPWTREVIPDPKDLESFQDQVNDQSVSNESLVLHNAKFDAHALLNYGINLFQKNHKLQDTMIAAHVYHSGERRNLEDQAMTYLGIPDDDATALDTLLVASRRIAKKLGWNIATHNHPDLPSTWSGKTKLPKCDLWIPRMLEKHHPDQYAILKEKLHLPELNPVITYAINDVVKTFHLWEWYSFVFDYWKNPEDHMLRHEDLYPTESDEFQAFIHGDEDYPHNYQKTYENQMQVLAATFTSERHGIGFLQETASDIITSSEKRNQEYLETCHQQYAIARDHGINNKLREEINLNSGQQLGKAMTEVFGIARGSLGKTASGGISTSADALMNVLRDLHEQSEQETPAYQFLCHFLVAKKIRKYLEFLRSYERKAIAYITRLPGNPVKRFHVLFPTFHVGRASTTRLASEDPNGQNIPKLTGALDPDDPLNDSLYHEMLQQSLVAIRSVFGPQPGSIWISNDFSQLQLMIFAFVSGEESLIQGFREGQDAHDMMCRRIFKLPPDKKYGGLDKDTYAEYRRIAKNVNFGFIFGASPWKIEKTAGKPGLWDDLMKMFPHAHQFMSLTIAQVSRLGYVDTPGGFRLRCNAPHKGVNYIVQGAEGELMSQAMVNVTDRLQHLKERYKNQDSFAIPLPVHDELNIEIPRAFAKYSPHRVLEFKDIMEVTAKDYGIETAKVDSDIISDHWGASSSVEEFYS